MEAVTEERHPHDADTMCGPLRHPTRVRILEVANERDISPVEFVREYVEPRPLSWDEQKRVLSTIAYHFRELLKAGCVEVVDRLPKRGSYENVYRGRSRVFFTTEEFARLPMEEREMLTRAAMQGLIARMDSALRAGTFDRRDDRHSTWVAMNLDERGWSAMADALDRCFEAVEQIRTDAEARLAETGEPSIPATFGLLGFESPRAAR